MPPLSAELSPLLTADVTETLAKQGIRTVADYVQRELVPLSRVTGLPYKLLTGIRQCLLAQFAPLPTTAAEIWRDLGETAALLPTDTSVDTLLGGGVMTGELTELTGVPSSGKTQLCHSLVGAGVLHSSSTVLWIDSTGGFSARRIHSILSNSSRPLGEESAGLLERIRVHRVFHLFDLLALLHEVSKRVSNQSDWFHANLHLLLVDSVTPLLSPLLGGHGGHGHALLSHLASQLRSLAYEHSLAVVYTNNTVSDMGRGGGVKPSLGQSWSCVPHTRLSLSLPSHPHTPPCSHPLTLPAPEQPVAERVAKITKSSRLAVGICTSFVITDSGIESNLPLHPHNNKK